MTTSQTNTRLLLVILIALLTASLVIAVALLFQGDEPPPDKNTRAQKPGNGRVIDIFEETGKAAGQ